MNRTIYLSLIATHGKEIFGPEFPGDARLGLGWIKARARRGCPLCARILAKASQSTPSPEVFPSRLAHTGDALCPQPN